MSSPPGTLSPGRRYSYRTEESYGVWIEQFGRFVGTDDLRSRGEADIAAFLDHLALNQRLSASSQRQALNALVFLFREVFKRELGGGGLAAGFAGTEVSQRWQGVALVLAVAGRGFSSGPPIRSLASPSRPGTHFSGGSEDRSSASRA
jgi:hypothetical protein